MEAASSTAATTWRPSAPARATRGTHSRPTRCPAHPQVTGTCSRACVLFHFRVSSHQSLPCHKFSSRLTDETGGIALTELPAPADHRMLRGREDTVWSGQQWTGQSLDCSSLCGPRGPNEALPAPLPVPSAGTLHCHTPCLY